MTQNSNFVHRTVIITLLNTASPNNLSNVLITEGGQIIEWWKWSIRDSLTTNRWLLISIVSIYWVHTRLCLIPKKEPEGETGVNEIFSFLGNYFLDLHNAIFSLYWQVLHVIIIWNLAILKKNVKRSRKWRDFIHLLFLGTSHMYNVIAVWITWE